eukprot:Opistho-1_new@56296
MHRMRTRTCTDTLLLQILHHLISAHRCFCFVYKQNIRLPTVFVFRIIHRCAQPFNVFQLFVVVVCPVLSFGDKSIQLLYLYNTKCTLQVSHTVVITYHIKFRQYVRTRAFMPLLFRYRCTMIAQAIQFLCQRIIVGCQHTTFTCCYRFARVERETTYIAQCTCSSVIKCCTCGTGTIFYYFQFGCYFFYLINICTQTKKVYRYYSFCLCCNLRPQLINIYIKRHRVYIYKHRFCTAVHHCICSRYPCESRHYHLVACTNTQCYQCKMQCCSTVRYCQCMFHAMPFSKQLFKLCYFRALCYPPAEYRFFQCFPLFLPHTWQRYRYISFLYCRHDDSFMLSSLFYLSILSASAILLPMSICI